MDINRVCCDGGLFLKRELIVKGGHALVGSITSNSWLVLSSAVHCVSVVPVAVYCRIEWCVSQPQSALAFRLAQLRALLFMSAQ